MKVRIYLLILIFTGIVFAGASLYELSLVNINDVGAIHSDGQLVYAGVGAALNLYNIYNRDFPQLVNSIDGHSSNIKSIIVEGNRLYVLWQKEGLEIFDITDRYTPTLMGKFPHSPDENFGSFTALDLEDDVAYICGKKYVASLDIADPYNPKLIRHLSLNATPVKLDFYEQRLYLAAGKFGLGVFYLPNPSKFSLLGVQDGIYTTVKAHKGKVLYGRLDKSKPGEKRVFAKNLFSFPFSSPTVVKCEDDVIFAGGLNNFAIYKLLDSQKNPQRIWNLPDMPTMDCVIRDRNAYLANGSKGLSVFDIWNLENPTEIGRIKSYGIPQRGCISGEEFLIAVGKEGVVRLETSFPENPLVLGTFGSEYLTSIWDVERHGDRIFVLGSRDDVGYNTFIDEYDLDYNRIAEYPVAKVDRLETIGEMCFEGDYCAVSLGSNGIVLMIKQLDNKYYPRYTIDNNSAQFCDMAIRGGILYASDYRGGYYTCKIDDGLPEFIDFIKTSDQGGNGVALVDKYLLAADGPMGLRVIDISDPGAMSLVGSYPSVWATDIALHGNYAFISEGPGGCKVFNISNLPELTLIDELEESGYWMHVYSSNNYIYGIDRYFGVYIYELLESEIALSKESTREIEDFSISGSYPNPFNAKTTISFYLPEKADVDLSIFDINGRKVNTLVRDRIPQGEYKFTWRADESPSGTYFAVLNAGEKQIKQKLLLIK